MARLAVIGAGWAGLAAAVHAVRRGHEVCVYEMAPQPGGRARTVIHRGARLDNGQHILIGAYTVTLAAMREVGVDPDLVLHRLPLALLDEQGTGLALPAGAGRLAWPAAVARHPRWGWADRMSLLRTGVGWLARHPASARAHSVKDLCRHLSPRVFEELVEPLCVAAMNTPAATASAEVFLRVLRDALFGPPGCSDLLVPRRPLGELFPLPAWEWLKHHGAQHHLYARVQSLVRAGGGRWEVRGETWDGVVLACPAAEAARLAAPYAPQWARQARALTHEPIVTVVVDCPGAALAHPMVCLPTGPAQFAFDHGAIGATAGRFTFVVSGAAPWLEAGRPALIERVMRQCDSALRGGTTTLHAKPVSCIVEQRATFACTAGLHRPSSLVCEGLVAAADYVSGPYPATLEGAVRAGVSAARQFD